MSKYYLVPVTTRGIKVNGKSLYEVLGMLDTELYVREKTRIELTYERKEGYMLQKSGYIQGYNEYTSILYGTLTPLTFSNALTKSNTLYPVPVPKL